MRRHKEEPKARPLRVGDTEKPEPESEYGLTSDGYNARAAHNHDGNATPTIPFLGGAQIFMHERCSIIVGFYVAV